MKKKIGIWISSPAIAQIIFLFYLIKYYLLYKYIRLQKKEDIKKYQFKKLKQFSKKVLKKSPYYNEISKKLIQNNPQNLENALSYFPILEKENFLLHFNEINTCGINFNFAMDLATCAEQTRDFRARVGNVDIGLSTGTSGKRGLFLVNKKEQALWAALSFSRSLHIKMFEKQRIALILRANNNLYESLGTGKIQFKYFDLLNPMDDIYEGLKKYDPTVIIGPPSCLELFAKYELKYNKTNRMQPKQIICAAETLTSEVSDIITLAWNKKPHQIYQATEGFLAYTCRHGALHMNEDLMIIEKDYIDKENGIFVPIITDFMRESQPIIRYRLTDVLVEDKESCTCGSLFLKIKRIEGRCDDVLYFSDKPIFPDFLTRMVLKSNPHIIDFRLVQTDKDNIHVGLQLEQDMLSSRGLTAGSSTDFFTEDTQTLQNEVHKCVFNAINEFAQKQNLTMPKYNIQKFETEKNGQKRRRVKKCFNLEQDQIKFI